MAERERWSSEATVARAGAEAATAEAAESRQRLLEELRELRGALELSSSTAEGLREALGLRDAERGRLRRELEDAAHDLKSLARERDEERAAAAAAAAKQEQERLLEQGRLLQADFAEREARTAKDRQEAVLQAVEETERRTAEREREAAKRAEGASEAEAATAKKQLRALSKYERRQPR